MDRIDHIEDRLVGIKSREVYECPAATVILEAHKDLEKMVMTRHQVLFKQQIDAEWVFLAYAGLWVDPLKDDLDAFINKSQENVTGEVKLKLYKGSMQVIGRSSPMSLYDKNLANYNIKTTFNQSYSKGFIELWGLQTRMYNALKKSAKKAAEKTKENLSNWEQWRVSEMSKILHGGRLSSVREDVAKFTSSRKDDERLAAAVIDINKAHVVNAHRAENNSAARRRKNPKSSLKTDPALNLTQPLKTFTWQLKKPSSAKLDLKSAETCTSQKAETTKSQPPSACNSEANSPN